MAWSTPHQGLFLAAGQAAQFSVTWGSDWHGVQLISPRLDLSGGGSGDLPEGNRILLVQWQGTGEEAVFGGPANLIHYVGIQNTSGVDIWFHLEGGAVQ